MALFAFLAYQASPVKFRLKQVSSHVLEERGDTILAGVRSVHISPSGSLMLISDSKSDALFLYSREGRLLNAFYANDGLTDSLIATSKPYLPGDGYVSVHDLHKMFNLPLERLQANLQNMYLDACFRNDSEIIAGSYVKAWLYHATDSRASMPKWTDLVGSLISLGIDGKIHNYSAVQVGPKLSWTWSHTLSYVPSTGHVISNVANPQAARAGHWDSTAGLGEIDLKGNYVRSLCQIPMQFMATGLGYNFLEYNVTSNGSKSFCAVRRIPAVYSLSGDKLFDLQSVTVSDEQFFRLASHMRSNSSISWDSLAGSPDFEFEDLVAKPDGGIVAVFATRNEHSIAWSAFNIQEYTETGSLISEALLDPSTLDGVPQCITYDHTKNVVIVLTSNKKYGWKETEFKEVNE